MRGAALQAKSAPRRENLRRVRRDRLRPLRVLEYLDNSAIFEHSPVEVKDGYIISDRDNGELFLVLIFRCLSNKPLAALDIRVLLFHERQPIPFQKIEFRYSWDEATFGERVIDGRTRKEKECRQERIIVHGEEFGQGIYLPLPENYFHRMQIELVGAEYSDGSYEQLGLIAGNRAPQFPDMDTGLRASYSRLNIFTEAEQVHPIRVLPQEGENVWLCCCGHKNPSGVALCEQCGRDKDWQLENLSMEKLEQTKREIENDVSYRILHDTSAYPQNRHLESEAEKQRKVERCNEALQRLAAQEKARERRNWMILPKIGLLVLLVFVIWFLAELLSRTLGGG